MARLAGLDDLVADAQRDVDRDRERQALVAAGARIDLGVDADDAASGVEQRATGIARIDGDIGLDERHIGIAGQRTALGTDDAGRGALFEAERCADGQHVIAYAQRVGRSEVHAGQAAGIDLQDGDVGCRVTAQHLCVEFPPVGQFHADAIGIAHDVRIGENQSVRTDDEARTQTAHGNLALWHVRDRQAPEETEKRIAADVRRIGVADFAHALDLDADDGRAEAGDDARPVGCQYGCNFCSLAAGRILCCRGISRSQRQAGDGAASCRT